jgi:hypothetical protein
MTREGEDKTPDSVSDSATPTPAPTTAPTPDSTLPAVASPTTVPALASASNVLDGFDEEDAPEEARPIIGAYIKFIEGEWSSGGTPLKPDFRPLVVDIERGLQRWENGVLIEERFEKPLPDLDALNEAIPKEQWGVFPNGSPKPPWSHAFKFYFLDDKTGTRATFGTNTVGGSICYEELKDKVKWIRKLRGPGALPRVQPTWAPMRTKHSPHPKKRPELRVIEYVAFAEGGFVTLPASPTPRLPAAHPVQSATRLQKVEEPTLAEEMDDEIPF